jgi:hypothetical protein
MNDYTVHIYKVGVITPRVHLSNPALYVTADSDKTVTFSDPDGSSWTIVFQYRTPFTTFENNVCTKTPIATIADHSNAKVCVLKGTAMGDYNYTITIDGSISEDPQVIVGGRGSVFTGAAIGTGILAAAGLLVSMVAVVVAFRSKALAARLGRSN